MKRIILNTLLVMMLFTLTQCFTETPEVVQVVPFDEIQEKLDKLRDLQQQLIDEEVAIVDLQAKIDDLIAEINNMVPTGSITLSYSIGVVSAAGTGDDVGVSNAVVTLDVRGTRLTGTTDSDGQVVFENLSPGVVTVHITAPDYTDVSFIADLVSGGGDNITSAIGLYPTTVANGASSISGTVYFDPDRTNDIIDPLDPEYNKVPYNNGATFGDIVDYLPAERLVLIDGVEDAINSPFQPLLNAREQSWETIDQAVNIFAYAQPNPIDYGYVPGGTPGNIILASYEEMFVSTTSSAVDGTFNLVVPTGVWGTSMRIHCEEFLGVESYYRAENTITTPPPATTVFTSRDRNVIFTPLYAQYNSTFYTPGNPFDQADINNFNLFAYHEATFTLDIYFGAKTRDE